MNKFQDPQIVEIINSDGSVQDKKRSLTEYLESIPKPQYWRLINYCSIMIMVFSVIAALDSFIQLFPFTKDAISGFTDSPFVSGGICFLVIALVDGVLLLATQDFKNATQDGFSWKEDSKKTVYVVSLIFIFGVMTISISVFLRDTTSEFLVDLSSSNGLTKKDSLLSNNTASLSFLKQYETESKKLAADEKRSIEAAGTLWTKEQARKGGINAKVLLSKEEEKVRARYTKRQDEISRRYLGVLGSLTTTDTARIGQLLRERVEKIHKDELKKKVYSKLMLWISIVSTILEFFLALFIMGLGSAVGFVPYTKKVKEISAAITSLGGEP